MTTLTNSFEGGTNGTTITAANSGGASGNAFDVVSIGASATLTFDNTHVAHGSLAGNVTTPVAATNSYAAWTTSMGTQTTVWFRLYLYYTANPANTHRVFTGVSGASNCGSLQVTAAGKLQWINSSNATILTSTAAIPLGAWFRIEGFITGSATVGQVELKLFSTPDSLTPNETDTSAATQNTLSTMNGYRFGVSGSTASVTFWMDDLGLSSTGYLGPAMSLPPAQQPGPAPRRIPARAVVQGSVPLLVFVAVPAPVQQPGPAPRRKPGRAYVRFTPVATVNAAPVIGVAGTRPVLTANPVSTVVRRTGRVARY
jgi:hypothetical protein